jgi:hypothetical protein
LRRTKVPGIGISLLFIAAGAILAFAVSATVSGVSIPAIGIILMAVGGIGLLFSLIYLMAWAPNANPQVQGDDHVHHV